ncbi:MAG: serine hydrolase [Gemmatimonadota bacterium]|nr:serine hydrolase [Gemmatimonadota bacterium]
MLDRRSLAALMTLATLTAAGRAAAQNTYFPPDGDEWETVEPESVGWDAGGLSHALDLAGNLNSSGVVILHNGRIMAERYWEIEGASLQYTRLLQGADAEGRAIEDVASAQKSVVALLIGIAQERGLLHLDDPVVQHLGSGWSSASSSEERIITVRHLLSMSSGLAANMNFRAEAGTEWLYNTPAYHRLMPMLEAITGEDRNSITNEWVTRALGMSSSSWTTRGGDPRIAWGFSTTARDLARFGLMVLAEGRWGDQVVVGDTDYLREMLSPSQSLNPAYGYLWWLNGQAFSLRGNGTRGVGPLISEAPADLVAMQGALTRKLYLVPSLGLVVARLGDNGNADGVSFNQAFWQALIQARR